MMDEIPGDIHHVNRDEAYLRQLEAEAEFWDAPQIDILDVDLPVIDRYTNERFTGDAEVAWFETIPRYGVFRRGCSIGAGALKQETRILEQNPTLHLTFYDISGKSLARRERELGARFPGRVATEQTDLNFVDLPESTYDLIVSSGCIHHLLNVEHMAYQINRSLTPEGYFFMYDYVGEARFQFAKEKKRLFEALVHEARSRHQFLDSWRIAWSDLANWEHSAFDAVRSDETLETFRRYLVEIALRRGCALLRLLLWMKPVAAPAAAPLPGWRRRLNRVRAKLGGVFANREPAHIPDLVRKFGPNLLLLDRVLSDASVFLPWDAFAIYRKRQPPGRAEEPL